MSRDGMSGRRRAALGALALGVALLGGCQTNPEPPPIEAAPSSLPPSPSPSETAPTLPAEAKGTSEAAAKAFVRHYIELVNYAMRTGDTRDLSSVSTPGCASCNDVAENIGDLYTDGGHLEGQGWEVRAIEAFPRAGSRTYAVQAAIRVHPQTRISRPGADGERFEGGKKAMTFSVRRGDSGWHVRAWSQTS